MPQEKTKKQSKRSASEDVGPSRKSTKKTDTNTTRAERVSDVITRLIEGTLTLFVSVDHDGSFVIRKNTRPVVSKHALGWDAVAATIPEEIVDEDAVCKRKPVNIIELCVWMQHLPQEVLKQITPSFGETFTWTTSSHDDTKQILLDPVVVSALASMMVAYFYKKDSLLLRFTEAQYTIMSQTWRLFIGTNTAQEFSDLSQHVTISQLAALATQLQDFNKETAKRDTAVNYIKTLEAMRFAHIVRLVSYEEKTSYQRMQIMQLAREGKTSQQIIDATNVQTPLQLMKGTGHQEEYAKLITETSERCVIQPTPSAKEDMMLPSKLLAAIQVEVLKEGNTTIEEWFGIHRDDLESKQYAEKVCPVNKAIFTVHNMVLADICKTSIPSRERNDDNLATRFTAEAGGEFHTFVISSDADAELTLRKIYNKIFDESTDALAKASLQYIKNECYIIHEDGRPKTIQTKAFSLYIETLVCTCIASDDVYDNTIKFLKNTPAYKAYTRRSADILSYQTPITFHEWGEESGVFEHGGSTPLQARSDLTKLLERWKCVMRHTWHSLPRYTYHVPLDTTIRDTTHKWWETVIDTIAVKITSAFAYMHLASKDVASDMLYLLLRTAQHSEIQTVKEFVHKTSQGTSYSVLNFDINEFEDETPFKPLPENGIPSLDQCMEAGLDTRKVVHCIDLDDDNDQPGKPSFYMPLNEFRVMKRVPPPPADTSMVIDSEQPSDETTNQNDAWRKLGPQLQFRNIASDCIAPFLRVLAVRMGETDEYIYDFHELQKVAHVVYTAAKSVDATTKFTKTNKDHWYYRNGICDMIQNAKNDPDSVFNRIAIPDTLTKKASCKNGQEFRIIPNLVTQLHTLFQSMEGDSIDPDARDMCVSIFNGLSRPVPDIVLNSGTGNHGGAQADAATILLGMHNAEGHGEEYHSADDDEEVHTNGSTPTTPLPGDAHGNRDAAAHP